MRLIAAYLLALEIIGLAKAVPDLAGFLMQGTAGP